MNLLKRKPQSESTPERDLADELRSARRRLRGWTVSGDGLPLDSLLDEAADEIVRLRAAVPLSGGGAK